MFGFLKRRFEQKPTTLGNIPVVRNPQPEYSTDDPRHWINADAGWTLQRDTSRPIRFVWQQRKPPESSTGEPMPVYPLMASPTADGGTPEAKRPRRRLPAFRRSDGIGGPHITA
jgi:hypothetical protein